MPGVNLTVSETLGGAAANDTLEGGGSGLDLGSVTNNSYAPLSDKTNNQGHQDVFVRHDATVDPITDVKTFIQQYGTGTGYTYGGPGTSSALTDFNTLKSLGNASGGSKNNADGLSGGLWIDMVWNSNDSTRFDQSGAPTKVKIYGDNNTDGISLASAFALVTDAMVYSAPAETSATSPVAGKIGKSGDTALGTSAHLKLRMYLPSSHATGGITQWEFVICYSFTA